MKSNRRRNYLRMLILASFLINLEITFLGTQQVSTVETATISELVFDSEPRPSRLIYYLVYANYQARELVISREAQALADFDETWASGPQMISNVQVVEQEEISSRIPLMQEATEVREYQLVNQMKLIFVQGDKESVVETVYAIRRDDTIVFYPDKGQRS